MATSDELKVYRDEGDEEQQVSENNLKELKNSLVTELAEREEENRRHTKGSTQEGKEGRPPDPTALNGHRLEQYLRLGGYVMAPYPGMPYPALPMINQVPFSPSMLMYAPIVENFQPPPAHMGIHLHRPHHHHLKTGLARPMYTHLPHAGQFAAFHPDLRGQPQWNVPEIYRPLSHLPPPPPFFSPVPASGHTAAAENNQPVVPVTEDEHSETNSEQKPHVKKPLNAFMLYMKDKRAEVQEEFRLKESAQINQVLGKRWHQLPKEEQAKYYERASREKDEHQQKYPDWSARENYAANAKKKKRKREKSVDADGNNPKKCRARFGLDNQQDWCNPCKRKKKCVRYLSSESASTSDNFGSSLEGSSPRLSDGDSGNVEDEGPSSVSSNSVSSVPTPSAPAMDESPVT